MTALNTVCLCLGYLSLSFACAIAIAYCTAGCVNGWRQWRAGRREWDEHTADGLANAADIPDGLPCGHDDCAQALDLARSRIRAALLSAADLAECRRIAALPTKERQR